MENCIEAYKHYLDSRNLSPNTVSSYIYDINSFKDYLYDDYSIDVTKTRKAQILTYLVSLQKQGRSSSTISRTISALKNFFEYLKKEKMIDDNPAMSIHSPKQIKKTPSVLTEEEVNQLMKISNTTTFKGSRDSAILELLYSSGIKVTELINIKIKHKNLRAGIININRKHNSRQGIWKILKYNEKKSNLKKELSPQILRNSFAVHLLSHGADLGTVQELMGLSSFAAAQNYLSSVEFKSLDVFKNTFPRV